VIGGVGDEHGARSEHGDARRPVESGDVAGAVTTSPPVVVISVRGPSAAVEEIVICALALVALLTVNELTVISPPKETVVCPCAQVVPFPLSVTPSVRGRSVRCAFRRSPRSPAGSGHRARVDWRAGRRRPPGRIAPVRAGRCRNRSIGEPSSRASSAGRRMVKLPVPSRRASVIEWQTEQVMPSSSSTVKGAVCFEAGCQPLCYDFYEKKEI
jgi:hypothetical protein